MSAIDPHKRFANRADAYAQYRPTYPPGCIDFLFRHFRLGSHSVVADIGSGTGILSQRLLERGCTVIGIEPNAEMRKTAEQLLAHTSFTSINGSGEHTGLANHTVDLITVAQAFHWLDPIAARSEFHRVAKSEAGIALLWNVADANTAFGRALEDLKLRFGKDYAAIRGSHTPDLTSFFYPLRYRVVRFPHFVLHDRAGLHGLLASSSFMPRQHDPEFSELTRAIDVLFAGHQENGLVRIDYDTHVHYGE
jgi:SAM-dependent methyltransferase